MKTVSLIPVILKLSRFTRQHMADPFSIVAVVGTGCKLLSTLTTFTKSLRDVPAELLALSSEVSELNLLLDHGSHIAGIGDSAAVTRFVNQARIKLDRLQTIVNRWGEPSQAHGKDSYFDIKRLDRVRWLKDRSQVLQLQKDLRRLRDELSVALGARAGYSPR